MFMEIQFEDPKGQTEFGGPIQLTENTVGREVAINARLNSVEAQDIEAS